MEITVSIKTGKGEAKTYQLAETREAAPNKDGKISFSHWQPAKNNTIVQPFSKLYIDTEALKKTK